MPLTRAVGINHVAIEVGDLDEALAFYGRIFELSLRGRHGRSMGCGLHHSAARFALQLSLLGCGCSCDEFNVR